MKHGKTWTNQAEEQLVVFMILLIANKMYEFAVVEFIETTSFSGVHDSAYNKYDVRVRGG